MSEVNTFLVQVREFSRKIHCIYYCSRKYDDILLHKCSREGHLPYLSLAACLNLTSQKSRELAASSDSIVDAV